MGIFDFLDERFDFNGDGSIDSGEAFLAYKEYEYVTGEEDENVPFADNCDF